MHRRTSGFTLVESACVLGCLGLLVATGAAFGRPSGFELTTLQFELDAVLHQARHLARSRGSSVAVTLGRPEGSVDGLGVRLPRSVHWGKPAHVPLPKGMADPRWADQTGQAHACVTFGPRGTATATSWFLSQGDETLCVRMNGQARWRMFRWRPALGLWQEVTP